MQKRAIRYFLGVHRFAPVLAIAGDMGWEPSEVRMKERLMGEERKRDVLVVCEYSREGQGKAFETP